MFFAMAPCVPCVSGIERGSGRKGTELEMSEKSEN